jgi:hypothetical protein
VKGQVCFCFCFALTLEELKKDLEKPKDFVSGNLSHAGRSIEELWKMCDYQIVKPYHKLKHRFSRYPEFRFLEDVKFEDYQTALNCADFETVILYSHCKNGGSNGEQIEFYDRLVDYRTVVAAIPSKRSMDLDLSICEPIRLRGALDAIPGRQFVTISWEERVDLEMGLGLYSLIFRAIRRNPGLSYSRIFASTIGSFIK